MLIDPDADDLAFALSQQREDAYFHAQVLRDALSIAGDIGFALKQHAMVVATERSITGAPARGADLTDSYDRYLRAIRRTELLARKIRADIVGYEQAAARPHPSAPEPAAPDPALLKAEAQPTSRSPRPVPDRPDRLDRPDREETLAAEDNDAEEGDEAEERLPDLTIPDLIEDIKRDFAFADPRQPATNRDTPENAPPEPAPQSPTVPWAYQKPPPEPAPPGVLTLDELSRRTPGPSG